MTPDRTRRPKALRRLGRLAIVASILVVSPLVTLSVIGASGGEGGGSGTKGASSKEAERLLFLSFRAAERVTYEGLYEVELRAPRLDFAGTFRIVHDPDDPSRSIHEIEGPLRIDGRPVEEDDPNVEIIEARRSFARTHGLQRGQVGGPITSGPQDLAYPILFEIRRFSIQDTELFRRNYEVRETGQETRAGRMRRILAVEPVERTFPHYRVELDARTGLLLACEKSFPDRPAILIRHHFVEIDIDSSSPPVQASEAPPEFRLPERRRFALSQAEAAELVPGFRDPSESELPRGFRLANVDERIVEPGSRAIQVEFSNGLERFFLLVRQAAFRNADPVAAALPRLSSELALDGVPAEVRSQVLERRRPFLETVFERIEEYESSARGSRHDAHVAWKRTQLGVTKFTVYGERLDFLIVGPVPDGQLLRSVEYLLAR